MIMDLLLYGLAIYGFVTIWVQVIQKTAWWGRYRRQELHLLILLHDSESYIEWLYRSLDAMSRSTGRPITITFIDCGSQDHTLRMLQLLTKEDQHVTIIDKSEFKHSISDLQADHDDRVVLIDLRTTII